MNLSGRTVLITGGASGIGAALGAALTARGARVGLIDRDERVHAVAAGLAGGVSAEADVRDREGIAAAVEEVAGHLGGLDVCVANAGIATGGPLRLVSPESVEDTIEINLLGIWRTVHAALPFVLDRPDGYVLMTASAAALVPSPGLGAYSASKAGVEALGRVLRAELAPHGVRVGVGYYLFLDTPMVAGGEAMATFRDTKAKLPGPLARTYPLEPAIEATVTGIERRARAVCYPRFLRGMMVLRGFLDTPLSELAVRQNIRPMEEAFAAEADRIGVDAASRPPHQR